MIQTVSVAQELYAKAAMVDHAELSRLQERNAQIDAEEYCVMRLLLMSAQLSAMAEKRGIPDSPLLAFRESGYEGRVAKERKSDARPRNCGQWIVCVRGREFFVSGDGAMEFLR